MAAALSIISVAAAAAARPASWPIKSITHLLSVTLGELPNKPVRSTLMLADPAERSGCGFRCVRKGEQSQYPNRLPIEIPFLGIKRGA
uniref:Putative secreted peptide n=1 Tax=Anopheles braziliensis TaxID=58242 RepID=A0A2M3ZXB7_9DIPT